VKHPVIFGGVAFGSTCARITGGSKPRRRRSKASRRDSRQTDLFEEKS
jgi:hypothetical protein